MNQESIKGKRWTKPRIARLGEIRDVAGSQTPLAQASGSVKS